ncbi:MAG: bifunctional aminoglycoside phosphotransferase/ATP-binding protein [Solirubrobacteraceae bacterium]
MARERAAATLGRKGTGSDAGGLPVEIRFMAASSARSRAPVVSGEDVRAALGRPDFYPARPDRVDVRETHISWVFLAGDHAYKLKKPLVLPFLDYGTVERRREMCREEVRLNRLLAPDVYLGVRAVAAGDDGLTLATEADPRAVDYVVEMRRYDERHTLAAKLECGELKRGEVVALARVLARFHARARRVAASGVPVLAIERRLTENFHELLAIVEQRAEVEWVLELERFAHAFVVAHARMLDARARCGLVREVHGDLRAEHVLLNETLEIVDCIEFDRGLRELDVADDLAFLVMDLAANGGERFARTLVRAYRDAGGDPGEDRLIAFYAAYRALVRAKVALVRASQHPASSSEHGCDSAAARDLLTLAERFAWQARLPLVIVVCGVPASGKSHLAQALAAASRLPHLSSDVTRKRLAGVGGHQRAGGAVYGPDFNRMTYAELGRRAMNETIARGGALVDATFRHRADRDAFACAFGDAAPVLFVECRAPAWVLAQRAAQRDRQPTRVSDASLSVVMRESCAWEPLDELPPEAHVTLRSDRPVEAQLEDLRALLDRRIGRLPGAA